MKFFGAHRLFATRSNKKKYQKKEELTVLFSRNSAIIFLYDEEPLLSKYRISRTAEINFLLWQ